MISKFRICILLLCLLLAGCVTPGTYFNINSASEPVHVGRNKFTPNISVIDANFFVATNTHGPSNPGYSLWYHPGYAYRVGSSDVLNIIVWDHPELSTPTTVTTPDITTQVAGLSALSGEISSNNTPGILVDSDGNIFFPYAGSLHVAGLNISQIRTILCKSLRRYIHNPQISIRVSVFRSQLVHVIGAVRQPGNTPIIDKPLTILDALANVGGVDSATANISSIFIVRGSGLQPRIFILNGKSPSNLLIAQNFRLMPGDIIYVPSAGISNWNSFINSILPTLTTVTYTNSLLH